MVAPTAEPPVCRLLDYGKYKYEQAKKDREARRGQRVSEVREVRIRPKIGSHDFEAKARVAKKLLEDGDKVKVTVLFRGREITHPEIAWKLLQRMAETLQEVASVEGQPVMVGRRMNVVMVPASGQRARKAKEEKEEKEDAKDKDS
jgi:translation initiation factor IF-3